MTPERFQQIERLAVLVLQQEENERKAFLDTISAEDRELRREVESLLAAAANVGTFLADHHGGEMRIGPAIERHHRRIGHPQSGNPLHPPIGIDHAAQRAFGRFPIRAGARRAP